MEVMMHGNNARNVRGHLPSFDYDEDTAHTVEIQREVNENGELGSFGFTLLYERPPIVRTVVPGGPAERAGLKKDEVVIAVNGQDVTRCSHQEVVTIISNTPTPGVWLTVCDSNQTAEPRQIQQQAIDNRLGFTRVQSLGSFSLSQSTPIIPQNIMEPRKHYTDDSPPPKYSDLPTFQRNNSASSLSQRGFTSSMQGMSTGVSPLKRKVLTQSFQPSGPQSSLSNGHFAGSDQSVFSSVRSSTSQGGPSPTPSAGAYTSASVLVLYIGPVEIPESWSTRELSSRCLQECTRRLLSQRQEFIEAFLDINLQSLKILNVSQQALFKHKREELYYCGVCTNDEQYFGIVTQKVRSRSGKKTSSSGGQVSRASLCHVFKVIQHKSVLVLHSGSPSSKGKPSQQIKPKTIPVMSCVTVINALQGLFTGEAAGTGKMFGSDPSIKGGSLGSGGSSESTYSSSPDKRKKLEVVDLRPSAFVAPASQSSFFTSNTSPLANPNIYVSGNSHSMAPSVSAPGLHMRHPANKGDYPTSFGTPAYHQRSVQGGGTWYSVDSPKENHHARQASWEGSRSYGGEKRNSGGSPPGGVPKGGSLGSAGRRSGGVGGGKPGPQFDSVRKISDDSSISSLSDCCTPSPTKLSLRSSFASRSRSPSPTRSLSYSSGSRSNSPSPARTSSKKIKHSPAGSMVRPGTGRSTGTGGSRYAAGLALELSSIRAVSPTHMSMRSSRLTLKRQGSENSVMDAQDPTIMSPYHTSLPPKNGPLSSSIGSVATLTTVADEQVDPEECGRVAGWVANFDKLLQDPLGVKCLLQFLEKEHCEENILFWRDAEEFKKEAQANQKLLASVKKIYDQYLAPSSPHTVNVDDRVLKAVEAKLSNPPHNIFTEAQEQIYQLMKMDCYPRFKKSELAKECLLCEMEGRPLPVESVAQQPQKTQQSQYTGIWKKHREFGLGRSLFSRWGRPRDIWGAAPDGKKWGASPEGKKGTEKGRKEEGSRTRKSVTVRENKSRSNASKEFRSSLDDASPVAEDFRPEDHLDIIQAHKRNVFEVNLPNKVTKIMAVPPRGSVKDAIQPVLKKHGYSFDIMELRFANNFKLIDLRSSASILVGQHIIVTKSKNTFIAAIPDVLERILPADGTKTVGELFYEVLEGIGKLQNFAVYMEGSRVPLDFNVDTSVLVGQKVMIKYLPGPCPLKSHKNSPGQKSKGSLHSSSSSSNGMDDFFSMLERVQGDTLADQKTSPSPRTTPEPSGVSPNSSPQSNHQGKHSPGEGRHRSHSHSKKKSGSGHSSHKSLSSSRSIDPDGHRGHHHGHRERSRFSGKSRGGSDGEERRSRQDAHLTPPTTTGFGRTQSGSSISSSHSRSPELPPKRALSPPAMMNHQPITDYELRLRNNATSPPPPTSKPPPLPSNVGNRMSGSRNMASDARWSNASFRSTDSASSEDSDMHARVYHGQYPDHTYVNRAWMQGGSQSQPDQSRYFPRAHSSHMLVDQGGNSPPFQDGGPTYVNTRSYQKTRPSSSKAGSNSPPMPSPPSENPHPLDNFVSEASLQAPSGVVGQRKTSHPLQNSLSRGPMTASGTQLSSYPWHNAQRRPSQPLRTAAQRRGLTENPQLMQAGDQLVKKEIDEFHHHSRNSMSDASSNSSDQYRAPLSPTTHTLILPDDSDVPSQQQLETFV